MLSKSSKYAIKGVLYLAMNASENNKVLAKDLAKPINVPPSYTAKLLQELGKHGIVSSSKGPNGGFYLSRENLELPLITIVEVIEGRHYFRSCLLSIKGCDIENPCPLHHVIGDIKDDFIRKLEETSIEDFIFDLENGNSVLPL